MGINSKYSMDKWELIAKEQSGKGITKKNTKLEVKEI